MLLSAFRGSHSLLSSRVGGIKLRPVYATQRYFRAGRGKINDPTPVPAYSEITHSSLKFYSPCVFLFISNSTYYRHCSE